MRKTFLLMFILFYSVSTYAQVSALGPADGNISIGYTFNTNTIGLYKYNGGIRTKIFIHPKPEIEAGPDRVQPNGLYKDNFILDPNYNKLSKTSAAKPFIIHNIDGPDLNTDGNYLRIPPDPYVAAGPDHIMMVINSLIFIRDKRTGKQIQINPMAMFNFIDGISPFDPKIIYDQFHNRWVTVWLHVDETNSMSYFLLAVSDDSDPNGLWYTWALPSNTNGNTPAGNWGDYPGLGYDDKAIYITSNQFVFSDNKFAYSKLRIIDKKNIYIAGDPGKLTWKDFWGINYPGEGTPAFGIRPVQMKEAASEYYLAAIRWGDTHNSFGIYKLKNVLTTPILLGSPVSTIQYATTKGIKVEQLDGGSNTIEHGDLQLRQEPVYINGKIHLVHPARFQNKIGVRYLTINANNFKAAEDVILGTPEHYYLYPALAVNKSNDVVITYTRVSSNEYAGVYFTFFPSDVKNFIGSNLLTKGNAKYELTLGGDRNRWGDYNGAWVDPTDENTFWIFSEYSKATDTWGTQLGGVRYRAFNEPYVYQEQTELNFGTTQLNAGGKSISFPLSNFGGSDLIISSIQNKSQRFQHLSPALPIIITSLDTVNINFLFTPTVHEETYLDTLIIDTNAPVAGKINVPALGKGFEIIGTEKNILYASTANVVGSLGRIASIDINSGGSTVLGKSGFKPVSSLTIDPTNNELYALSKPNTNLPSILKLRSDNGLAMLYEVAPLDLKCIAFDKEGLLHAITNGNEYYTVEIKTLFFKFIKKLDYNVSALAINTITNEMIVASNNEIVKDQFYKLNKDGNLIFIGSAGLGKMVQAISFDKEGKLYASIGNENDFSELAVIDVISGSGQVIGNMNLKGVIGLAYSIGGLTSLKTKKSFPVQFNMSQNYPNPFNPSTNIEFTLPDAGVVKIVLYNLLGEKIKDLVDTYFAPGVHSFIINESITSKMSSGIYFYKIEFQSIEGEFFSSIKKMLLIK